MKILNVRKAFPCKYMHDKIHQALMAAFKKDNPECADNVVIVMDEEKKRIDMFIQKTVVEELENPAVEILLDEAKNYSKRAKAVDGQCTR